MVNVIIVCALTLLLSSVFFVFGVPKLLARKDSGTKISTKTIVTMSSGQISENLESLNIKDKPLTKMEAMCYSMAPPEVVEPYICPVCHEKTYYDKSDFSFSYSNLLECRELFINIKKPSNFSIALDELSFCSHCSPDSKDHLLKLIVTYNDGSTHKASLLSLNDLLLLKSFIEGSSSYKASNGNVVNIKDQMPRLRLLLGEKNDPAKYKR